VRRSARELAPEQTRYALGLRAVRRRRRLLETASGTSVAALSLVIGLVTSLVTSGTSVTALRLVIGLVTSLVTSGARVALRLESLFSVGGTLPGGAAVSVSSAVSVVIWDRIRCRESLPLAEQLVRMDGRDVSS
jgi:hypothetical protein